MTALLYLLGVVLFVVGMAASIALHECGHMIPAKRFGVRVPQFFVGFGRTLWSTTKNGTEYGIKAFPLGGYVRLVGMLPSAEAVAASGRKPRKQSRFAAMIADARNADHELAQPGDEQRAFYRLSWWKKVIVMAGGPLVNLGLAYLLFVTVFMGFGVHQPSTTIDTVADCVIAVAPGESVPECGPTDPAAPARVAGLLPGDQIVAINGSEVKEYPQLQQMIRQSGQGTVSIELIRDGQALTVTAHTQLNDLPSLDPTSSQVERVGYLGISPVVELVRPGPGFAATQMVDYTKQTGRALVRFPAKLWGVAKAAVGAEPRDPTSPVSIVGVSRIAGEITATEGPGWADRAAVLVMLLGAVNLFVGMFNLIPLTPLDGGRIAGALYEGVRNGIRRLRGHHVRWYFDEAPLLPFTYAMAAMILLLSLVLIYADFVAPVTM